MLKDTAEDRVYVYDKPQLTVLLLNFVLLTLRFRLFALVAEGLPLMSFPSFTAFFLEAIFKIHKAEMKGYIQAVYSSCQHLITYHR